MEIVIDDDLARDVEDYCREVGREPEEFVLDVLRRRLAAEQPTKTRDEILSGEMIHA